MKNDPAQALREDLESARLHGEAKAIARLQWQLGQLDIQQGDPVSALSRLMESHQLNQELGQRDGVCAVGLVLGQLLAAGGQTDAARTILTEARDGFRQLGQLRGAQQAEKLLGLLTVG